MKNSRWYLTNFNASETNKRYIKVWCILTNLPNREAQSSAQECAEKLESCPPGLHKSSILLDLHLYLPYLGINQGEGSIKICILILGKRINNNEAEDYYYLLE